MDIFGWAQLFLFAGILLAATKPTGLYLCRVLDPKARTIFDFAVKPLERSIYRICGIDPLAEQTWKHYSLSLGLFSLVGALLTYAMLRFQQSLPLNPQGFGAVSPDLAFNTAVSFTTNTNWQNYAGESVMSHWPQMVALTLHNFTSAAVGIAAAAAIVPVR